jgi:hypothetical protein
MGQSNDAGCEVARLEKAIRQGSARKEMVS